MFQVSEETLKKASKCEHDRCCLKKGGNCPSCTGEDMLGTERVFVKALKDKRCAYAFGFGFGFFCACPVRSELFSKYKI